MDKDRTYQVVINLLNNAIKSTEEGTISVETTGDEEQATIYVKDIGPGIKQENMERIFRPFEQAETGDTGEKGSGLGLAICKGIIEYHGGGDLGRE